MQRNEEKRRIIIRECIYTLSVIALCWIGVWRDIGSGAQWAFAVNCTGFCFFPLIVLRFDWKRISINPYIIWLVVFSVLALPVYKVLAPGTDYDASILVAVLTVGMYGIVIIRCYRYIFVERLLDCKRVRPMFLVWLGFVVFAIVSKNVALWPIGALVILSSFYLAPFSQGQRKELTKGIILGILISFFWIQGRALLYRPFDTHSRYYGHFTNPNINAQFYLVVYCAFLSLLFYSKRAGKRILGCLALIFSCVVCDLVLMTGARGSMIAFVVVTVFFLLMEEVFVSKSGVPVFLLKGIGMLVLIALMLYPVYAGVRYIPALRHHPVWYRDYDENKVHSWDSMDSDKYVSFDEVLDTVLGRFKPVLLSNKRQPVSEKLEETDFVGGDENNTSSSPQMDIGLEIDSRESNDADALPEEESVVDDYISPKEAMRKRIKEYPVGIWIYEYNDGVPAGSDENHPAMEVTSWDIDNGILGVRKYIHKYFIERMNLMGHEVEYPYVWFGNSAKIYGDEFIKIYGEEFMAPILYGHTHSSFIQFFYNFGLIAGVLWMLLIFGPAFVVVREILIKKSIPDTGEVFAMIFSIAYAIDGLVECLCFPGKFMFVCLFINLLFVMRHKTKNEELETECNGE